jgi:hypothetical protein
VDGIGEIQLPAIVRVLFVGHGQVEVSKRERIADEFLIADPQRVFVELDAFFVRVAVDHATESTVADRQAALAPILAPVDNLPGRLGSRLVVPEPITIGMNHRTDQ